MATQRRLKLTCSLLLSSDFIVQYLLHYFVLKIKHASHLYFSCQSRSWAKALTQNFLVLIIFMYTFLLEYRTHLLKRNITVCIHLSKGRCIINSPTHSQSNLYFIFLHNYLFYSILAAKNNLPTFCLSCSKTYFVRIFSQREGNKFTCLKMFYQNCLRASCARSTAGELSTLKHVN